MKFCLNIVCFEQRHSSVVENFISWHQSEVEKLQSQALHDRFVLLPTLCGDWELPAGFWAPFSLSLWYIGFRISLDVTSLLRVFVVTECVVSVAVYSLCKVHGTCQFWNCLSSALHALPLLPFQGVSEGSGYRDLQLCMARIERTYCSRVLFRQPSSKITISIILS